jgi:methylated-DNA-[protein]-cysteine S-methyltransferase
VRTSTGLNEVSQAMAIMHARYYGEIAAQLGDSSAAREVGLAMGSNPFPIIVPCHRVLAGGGIMTKLRLLNFEGAEVGGAPALFESLPLAARPRRR